MKTSHCFGKRVAEDYSALWAQFGAPEVGGVEQLGQGAVEHVGSGSHVVPLPL